MRAWSDEERSANFETGEFEALIVRDHRGASQGQGRVRFALGLFEADGRSLRLFDFYRRFLLGSRFGVPLNPVKIETSVLEILYRAGNCG